MKNKLKKIGLEECGKRGNGFRGGVIKKVMGRDLLGGGGDQSVEAVVGGGAGKVAV